jgi:hypothetical protein
VTSGLQSVRLLPHVAYSAGLLKTKPKDIWKHFSSKDAAGSKLCLTTLQRTWDNNQLML